MRLVTLLLAMMLAPSCSRERTDAGLPSPGLATPQTITLQRDSLERVGIAVDAAGAESSTSSVELPGTLEYVADSYAEVGYLAEARITAVHANVGDRVKRGQPLATLLVPEITSAQAKALSAQATLDVARDHAKREALLLEGHLTSKSDEELARGKAVTAEADLAAAKANLALLGATVPESTRGIRANGLVTLASPIDGVVVARDAVLGAFVEPKDTVFAVADPRSMWAILDVFESELAHVREGLAVELTVDALPGVHHGKVAMIEPQVGHASRALRARVVVPNDDGVLRRGLFVRAKIPIAAASGLVIPRAAVQPLGDRDVVFVEKEPGVFEVRTVKVRTGASQLAQVDEGLTRGERIVVRGAFLLRGEVTKQ